MRITTQSSAFHVKIYLVILLLSFSSQSYSQSRDIKFTKLEGLNGISLGKINAFAKDDYGFLWLSDQTNRCIIRYDGSHMTRYSYDPSAEISLKGFYPECFQVDSNGVLWIGYYGQGIDRFDTRTGEIVHYENNPDDPTSLSHNQVSTILRDHLGQLWVGSYGGLDLLDEEHGTFTNYSHDPNDAKSLSHNEVRTLYEDSQGNLWIGTGMAFFLQDDLGGLNRLNREDNSFTRYLHDPDDPSSMISNKVRAIFEDSKGNFWVGTDGDGLHTMDRDKGTFIRHTYDPGNPTALSRSPLNDLTDHITFITEDSEENIWIGTESGGILCYDPQSEKIKLYGVGGETETGFDDQSGWSAITSKDGLLWISTQQSNVFKVDLFNAQIPKVSNDWRIKSFFDDDQGRLWLATNRGLVIQDPQKETVRIFSHNPSNSLTINSDRVNFIFQDSRKDYWICTRAGLNKFNPITQTFLRYTDEIPSNTFGRKDIEMMIEDSQHNLWLGVNGVGLLKKDASKDSFRLFQNIPTDFSSISGNWVNAILQEDENHLLIGNVAVEGLSRMDMKTEKFERLLPGLNIYDICKDSNGDIWLATANGMYIKDSITQGFIHIAEVNREIDVPGLVKSIVEDDDHNLWIGSSSGLFKINKERSMILQYGKDNGIQGNEGSELHFYHKARDGTLYFNGRQEYYVLQPDKLKTLDISSDFHLYFTNFWLSNKRVLAGNHRALKKPLFDAEEINLHNDENVFGLSFTNIDYRSPGEKRILYKMENYDTDWRNAYPEERINYFKVPPGNYIFRIKAANNADGRWEEKQININIAKPWWQQWWAFILYILILSVGVRLIHNIQKKRVLRAEREKAREKELQAAKEIEKAYTELKTTQNQLIHAEKMASLGELTAGIAHEIKNPLNFVNNFAEVSGEMLEEMQEAYESKNNSEAREIATDLKQNLEKIQFHGKRADGIVKGMLQHSRANNGEKLPTNINELADEYLRLAYHGLRAKDKSFNSNMEIDLDDSIGEILTVPQDIGRVLINLITNAFYAVSEKKKQTDNGYKPNVTVKTKKSTGVVEISVSDNGNGIPKEVQGKIFQPFFTTKPTGQGTGLGLSMSYDIIKAHSGTIELKSEAGEGSEFIVKLPNT